MKGQVLQKQRLRCAAIRHSSTASLIGLHAGRQSRRLEVGFLEACALSQGNVLCWGQSYKPWAEGRGIDVMHDPGATTAMAVPGLTDIIDVGLGYRHGGALAASGTVFCWGVDSGYGSLGNAAAAAPVEVLGLP